MASLVLGTAGAVIGGAFFGPLGASLGWALGAAVGNALFPNTPPVARLHDLHLQSSSYGTSLKIFYGKVRIAGNVIWETDLQEHVSGGKGGKDSGGGQASYTASWDTAISETQVAKLCQIFDGGRLNYDADQSGGATIPFVFYDGNSSQLPDPTEEAVEGAGNVPAYRGISRIVYHDRDLGQFGNTLPQESFVVTSKAGSIPWRVSSFDPTLDPSTPYNISATFDPETEVITVGTYYNTPVVYKSAQFLLDGTPVGSPTGPDSLDQLASVDVSTTSGQVKNLQACFCYHAGSPGVPNCGWFVGTHLVAPVDTLSKKALHGVYHNGFIYAIADASTLDRWVATDGVPTPTVDMSVGGLTAAAASDLFPSAGDGHIFVSDAGAIGSSIALWLFDEDLNFVHSWMRTDLPTEWNGTYTKIFYHGMLAGTMTPGGGHYFYAYRLNADFTFTTIGNIQQPGFSVGSPAISLTRGLLLGEDGVISLDPPDGTVFLSEVVADLCSRAGLTSGQYNVTALSAIIVDGFVIESQTTCRAAIEMLMPVYFFDAVERDGVIVFVVRGGQSVVTFLDDDLAAHMDHDGLPSILSCVHTPDADLPGVLNIAYINKDGDYQVNTQTAQRMTGGSRDARTISVPIVLTDSHAKKIVDSWLYNAWSERDAYTWFSSRKYAAYEPTDVCTVQGKVLRITKKLEGATGVIKWEGVLSRGANFTQAGAGGSANDPSQTLPILQKSQLLMLDLPLLNDGDSANGVYAATAGVLNSSYPGGGLFKSMDGTTYDRIATATRANTIGAATTKLGDYQGPNVFDESNVVRIAIGKGGGTLSSVTQTDVLNGDNEGVLGSEVFQWKNATLISPGVYDLSGLLRGRRGTEWATNTHIIGDMFVAFDPALLNPAALISEVDTTEYYKAVTVGQTLANATAKTFANTGNALKTYSPTYLGGGCDASGNVTLNWLRRTRIGGGGRFVGPKPLSEATESYIVQIWDAAYTLCARIIPTTTQTCPYSSANQVTDFGANQKNIFFTVGQLGANGLGSQSRGVATGIGGSNGLPTTPITPYQANPIISPPAPPGGSRPVDHVFTQPNETVHVAMVVGQVWVGRFTTGLTPGGQISVAEYSGPTLSRTAIIATDTGGLNIVPGAVSHGTTVGIVIGVMCTLLPSTTYYFIVDFKLGDGSYPAPVGTAAGSLIQVSGVT